MSLHKWFPPKAGEIANCCRENPKERRIRRFWRTGIPSFWIQLIVRVLRKRTGATGERNKWELFLDFVFLPEFRKKIPNAEFFLRILEKRIQKTSQWSLSSSAECNTRFDLQIAAVCETHELHRWECKGLNHVCGKPVTWVGQRHWGRHSFAPSTQFLRPLCCTVAVTALKRCCEVPCFTAASCLCTYSSASVLCRYTTTGPPSSCRWVKASEA